MNCINPVPLTIEKKNGRKIKIAAPCGKCETCLVKKKQSWVFRITSEFSACESAYFVTLTYNEDCIPLFNSVLDEVTNRIVFKRSENGLIPGVYKKDVQLFLKRLRKDVYPFKLRYFLASEYGSTTQRPHYHMILFDFPRKFRIEKYLERNWQKGFFTVSPVLPARIAYTAKYCVNSMDEDGLKRPKPFILVSNGMGLSYLNSQNIAYHKRLQQGCIKKGDDIIPLPRYLKEKIFTYDELDEMSIKEERRMRSEYYKTMYKCMQDEEFKKRHEKQVYDSKQSDAAVARRIRRSSKNGGGI